MTNPFKIRVEGVSKIFGPDPRAALTKVNAGLSKGDLLAQGDVDAHDLILAVVQDVELEGGIVGGGA